MQVAGQRHVFWLDARSPLSVIHTSALPAGARVKSYGAHNPKPAARIIASGARIRVRGMIWVTVRNHHNVTRHVRFQVSDSPCLKDGVLGQDALSAFPAFLQFE